MSAPIEAVARAVEGRLVKPSENGLETDLLADVTHDSRQVAKGWLFVCMVGESSDGHDFASAASQAGAAALLVERELDLDVPQIVVPDCRQAIGLAAAEIHDHPTKEITVVGVTGTNGKSSIVQLLQDIWTASGIRSEIVGTLSGPRTTPEASDLQRDFRRMANTGVAACAIEVSSHGLELGRVNGTNFAVSIFTNLGRDHLDFHLTLESYYKAKAKLFSQELSRLAVINEDDEFGARLLGETSVPAKPYSMSQLSNIEFGNAETEFEWRDAKVKLPLIGAHNASNALAAAEAATLLDIKQQHVIDGLANTVPVRGRFEMVDEGQDFVVAVDYAHTPDALDAALRAARGVAGDGRLIVLFGCAGDRDATKRPEMGQVAGALADVAIVTSDNPRSEDPEQILEEVVAGFAEGSEVVSETDRKKAISIALKMAKDGDFVLVAGKGHETYQHIGDQMFDFDDHQVCVEVLETLK